MQDLKKGKLKRKSDAKTRLNYLQRPNWIDALLTEAEIQAVEDILVDYHNIFAEPRMENVVNTEFKVKLTPKDDKAVYNQNLPMPIHLREDEVVELALMHKYGIITVLPFLKVP